jgi:phosphoribosylaminoimidazolecarboxamide formyltransferase/IMP cyclohydrolase
MKNIKSALLSVFDKDNLEPIVRLLHANGVEIYSTGGTQSFIEKLGVPVIAVEDLTGSPSIFGGRVKTLHPKIFGGILHRRELQEDLDQAVEFDIPEIDLVIVDLYPFEDTVASGASEQGIIEKIDIGGISLIRAAAKNFKDVIIVGSKAQYAPLQELLEENGAKSEITDRKWFATQAFGVSSHYDTAIFNYFSDSVEVNSYRESFNDGKVLRYGENPHQKGEFFGDLEAMFEQLNGKELSYNNLIDVDAAVNLIDEFKEHTAVAILKHNNACGIATADSVKGAYLRALESDPISAFGGVIISTKEIDVATAEELNKLFFEVLIAPSFAPQALEVLKSKKNRILLVRKEVALPIKQVRTLLNGVIRQDKDVSMELANDFTVVTKRVPSEKEVKALEFANKVCKHTKSNAIVLAVDGQMITSGLGQTSRVDALNQAIEKAKAFELSLEGAVMASDAFFPFPDCVEIAKNAGIKAVVQPGGSIKDQLSIDYCDSQDMVMVTTGVRHFKH